MMAALEVETIENPSMEIARKLHFAQVPTDLANWTCSDVSQFLNFAIDALRLPVSSCNANPANLNGRQIKLHTENELMALFSLLWGNEHGPIMFDTLRTVERLFSTGNVRSQHSTTLLETHLSSPNSSGYESASPQSPDQPSNSDNDSLGTNSPVLTVRRERRKLLLWQFLWNLLQSGKHADKIEWTDYKHYVFKFVDRKAVSELWDTCRWHGVSKSKKKMNYQSMSRSIRSYYKMEIMHHFGGARCMFYFNEENLKRFGYI